MIGDPPLLAGGFHENETDVEVVVAMFAIKSVGGSGTVIIIRENVKLESIAKFKG